MPGGSAYKKEILQALRDRTLSEEDLRRHRAESVNNVKRTNGRISLEKYARGTWEDEDEWRD